MINQKGIGVFGIIIIAFAVILVLPIVLFTVSEISLVMFQVIMVFLIISYVRSMGIDGPLMWILSVVLIYFLVWKYPTFTAVGYTFMLMVSLGISSSIIFGAGFFKNWFGR